MSLRVRRLEWVAEPGLEPDFRKEDGGSGYKARAGRQPDPRQANPCSGKTPWTDREGFLAAGRSGAEGM